MMDDLSPTDAATEEDIATPTQAPPAFNPDDTPALTIDAAMLQELGRIEAEKQEKAEKQDRDSQADQIVKFAQSRYDLLHDEQKAVYAKSKATGIVCRLGSRAFKDDLYSAYYGEKGKAIKSASYSEALDTLTAIGVQGEPVQAFLRVAHHEGAYYLDLCQAGNSHAVCLRAGAWQVIEEPPVVFVRGEAMQALPVPVAGGSLGMLWEVLNVPADTRLLVLAFLIDSMRPETPFAGLELLGEQGSGKSMTAKFIRRLLDPNACDLRGAPRSVEDVFVVAAHSHMVTFENISHLGGGIQDALCILSTGGGMAKRSLYTNDEESIVSVRRPWIVNGISAAITQQDLIDRTISIDCPRIEERGTSTDLNQAFEANQAALLGAVLDTAAKALAILPSIALAPKERPRLAEFAMLGMAIAKAAGQEPKAFMTQFTAARQESIARVLDASPVATAVLEWVSTNPQGTVAPVKSILKTLEEFKPVGTDAWPRSAKGLGDALRRAAPALRQMGIECQCLGKVGGAVKWSISQLKVSSASPASPEVLPQTGQEQDIRTFRTCTQEFLSTRAAASQDREVF